MPLTEIRVRLNPTRQAIDQHRYDSDFIGKIGVLSLEYYDTEGWLIDFKSGWEGKILFKKRDFDYYQPSQYIMFEDLDFISYGQLLAMRHHV